MTHGQAINKLKKFTKDQTSKVFNEFRISYQFVGEDQSAWNIGTPDKYVPHYHFKIRVYNDISKKSCYFDFWDSHKNYTNGKDYLTQEDLLWAFQSFLQDSESSLMGLSEFGKEFGYTDLETGLRVFKACKKSFKKALRLGIDKDSIYSLLHQLSEIKNNERIIDNDDENNTI